ncbi:TPA: hypothetical protein DEB02_05500 [Candidatus Beckwithbacteria bacterium]|nr:hypothetical protein [Candidatus Beckwithbacteria bacterium]
MEPKPLPDSQSLNLPYSQEIETAGIKIASIVQSYRKGQIETKEARSQLSSWLMKKFTYEEFREAVKAAFGRNITDPDILPVNQSRNWSAKELASSLRRPVVFGGTGLAVVFVDMFDSGISAAHKYPMNYDLLVSYFKRHPDKLFGDYFDRDEIIKDQMSITRCLEFIDSVIIQAEKELTSHGGFTANAAIRAFGMENLLTPQANLTDSLRINLNRFALPNFNIEIGVNRPPKDIVDQSIATLLDDVDVRHQLDNQTGEAGLMVF